MSDLSAITPPVTPTPPTMTAAEMAKRGDIKKTAEGFEASFLSVMFGQMFEGVDEGEFSGGQGAKMFRSFMTDAMAKSMVKSGGVGIASSVQAEMLKMQGLS